MNIRYLLSDGYLEKSIYYLNSDHLFNLVYGETFADLSIGLERIKRHENSFNKLLFPEYKIKATASPSYSIGGVLYCDITWEITKNNNLISNKDSE